MASLYDGAPDFGFSLIDRMDVSGLVNRGAPTRVTIQVSMVNPATGLPGSRAAISAVLPAGSREMEVRRHLYATLRAYIAENAQPEPNEPQSRRKRRDLDTREGSALGYRARYEPAPDMEDYDDDVIDEGDDGDADSYGPVLVYAVRY